MLTEADTCRKHVVPKLQSAGWDNEPHSIAEQRTITDGRVVPVGKGFIRKPFSNGRARAFTARCHLILVFGAGADDRIGHCVRLPAAAAGTQSLVQLSKNS